MRRIVVPAVLCLLTALTHAQSGRRDLSSYDPEREVDAIFKAEEAFTQKMSSYVNVTRAAYEVEGGYFERTTEVGRDDAGQVFERKRLGDRRQGTQWNGRLVLGDVILRWRDDYRLTRLREDEGGLRVFAVNPLVVPLGARVFRGEIWVNERSEIVKASGEWLPRRRDGEVSLACTVVRENGLPKSMECDDWVNIKGVPTRVVARVEHFDFRRFGADSKVVEEGEPGEIVP
jgi:hypothetical protein